MPPRTRMGSTELGATIRDRRTALGLSIEEVALKAGIGTKTWSRYEAGSAIREDKVRGLCKALGWAQLPEANADSHPVEDDWLQRVGTEHSAWSRALEENFGRACAVTFAVSSDLLSDQAADDLAALARERRGTHVGELGASWLDGTLPLQFVPQYDYNFVYALHAAVDTLRTRFTRGSLVAISVMEELALYLILSNADMYADMDQALFAEDNDWREWLAEILADLDIEFFLFGSGALLIPAHAYHFDHWLEPQFNSEREVDGHQA